MAFRQVIPGRLLQDQGSVHYIARLDGGVEFREPVRRDDDHHLVLLLSSSMSPTRSAIERWAEAIFFRGSSILRVDMSKFL